MKLIITSVFLLSGLTAFAKDAPQACHYWLTPFKPICQQLRQVWLEGNNEVYLSGYAWHNRFTYPREKINFYNEAAWGGGLGKGYFDDKGNWHGLFAFAFLDSHKEIEPAVGYAYLKVLPLPHGFKTGLGYTVLVTSRTDINNRIPFPGILPWTSIFYKKVTLAATYIPGFHNNGNVLYMLVKYTF
jgi:palmitoyl transferase